jgi:hypothetical protein
MTTPPTWRGYCLRSDRAMVNGLAAALAAFCEGDLDAAL